MVDVRENIRQLQPFARSASLPPWLHHSWVFQRCLNEKSDQKFYVKPLAIADPSALVKA